MEQTDVLIIGGGLAGLSAASMLCATSNLNVILIEQKEVGWSQGIRAVFREAIKEFSLEESCLCDYKSFIWHSPSGALSRFNYEMVELVGIDYGTACRILLDRAKNSGLRLLQGAAADLGNGLPNRRTPIVVNLEDGRQVEAQVVVDASGKRQWGAQLLGMRPSRHYSVCYGEVISGCSFEDQHAFRFLGPCAKFGNGGGWFYPCGQDRISMGYSIVLENKPDDESRAAAGYFSAKKEFEPYASWVSKGTSIAVEKGVIPVGKVDRFVADRFLIIGDAGGQAYPWAIEGCRPSLINGRMCGQVVIEAFMKGRFGYDALYVFQRAWNKINRNRFWRTAAIANLTWAYSDQAWDDIIRKAERLSAEQQLLSLKENRASLFHKLYAVAGFWRRNGVQCAREWWRKSPEKPF